MPDHHSLEETEQATRQRVKHLPLDYGASHALLSLYRAANAVRSNLTTKVLRPNDLTWTGFLVLWTLWIWDSMETRDIADSVGISKGTLTGVAKTLSARNLIERIPSTVDRRLVNLRLSSDGLALMDRIYPEFNRAESDLVGGLDAAQVDAMTQALRTLVETSELD
ncbi:MarR family winged helix-turn-helix transcriptional regulator [Aeromicrobium fastidiosum]|uniref:MarR family transcriptional regulator n=1 Tax=Aeromicrobium fastidiosum TaxID=52699 RepID=A0A641ASE3_9ACTN|nr:MarR family transcriptional regulator [Aeromicrobium fastidiosum]KAA1380592.1 MarR family transcriptional regulator [Aeromicrobium fastidiosum]MBP2390191.1 DNA-binding MarR family transcriptional regulator [Aeromicrobium fastidiosum]